MSSNNESFEPENFQEEEDDEDEGLSFGEYDITSSPNDFNVKTIVDFIDKGVFKIPQFQRNYVWDISRASKFIESLILGLPIPQIFLYEEHERKNNYLVIDGQQRLMSLYYFLKSKFPVMEKRNKLRVVFDQQGNIPSNFLDNTTYFTRFNLKLPSKLPDERTKLHGLNYETLGDLQFTLDLRTIRCVIIKQNLPKDDDSSIFEIFNRLNTGGINLTPQEIRSSLYHSDFMQMVLKFNSDSRWRKLLDEEEPDLRMKDVEILLRGFAMLTTRDDYAPSMTRFLNKFAKKMKSAKTEQLALLEDVLGNFFDMCKEFPRGIFGTGTKKLNISVFEAVFFVACKDGYIAKNAKVEDIPQAKIEKLKNDKEFARASSTKSTNTDNVDTRLKKAKEILLG